MHYVYLIVNTAQHNRQSIRCTEPGPTQLASWKYTLTIYVYMYKLMCNSPTTI